MFVQNENPKIAFILFRHWKYLSRDSLVKIRNLQTVANCAYSVRISFDIGVIFSNKRLVAKICICTALKGMAVRQYVRKKNALCYYTSSKNVETCHTPSQAEKCFSKDIWFSKLWSWPVSACQIYHVVPVFLFALRWVARQIYPFLHKIYQYCVLLGHPNRTHPRLKWKKKESIDWLNCRYWK